MMKYVFGGVALFFLVLAWKIRIYLKRIRKQKEANRPFYRWAESVHQEQEQRKRLEAARNETCIFEATGNLGAFYRIKFLSDPDFVNCAVGMCQCQEFRKNHKPCKHIYKIALNKGLIQ